MLTTTDLTPRIGTEIKTDRETLASGTAAPEIRKLLADRGVLVFRQIGLTDEQQVALASSLGEVLPQGEKGILKVTLDPEVGSAADYLRGSFFWHFDGALEDVPSLATLLSGRYLSDTGGETEFCNTYAAFDDLPDSEKKYLESLRIVHNLEASQRLVHPDPTEAQLAGWRGYIEKKHPLVWTHQSGRKSLLAGASAFCVADVDREESDAVLKRVIDWATQPKYVYRHAWQVDDLVIWDNTGTLHRVAPYALDSGRLMHRTALAGEEAIA